MDLSESVGRGFSLAGESIGQGFQFGKMNWKGIFLYYFVAGLIMALAAAAGALIGGGIAYFTYGQIGWAAAAAIGVALFIIIFVAGLSYGYAPVFGAVEYIYNNKKTGYFESSNVGTGFKWAVVGIAALMAVMLAFGGAILAMATIPVAGILLFMLFYMAFIAAVILVAVIGYYAIYEGAIKKTGPVGAIVASYGLIKANFWETLVFAFLAWAISYIAGLVAGVAFYIFYLMGIVLMLVSPIAAVAMIGVAFLVLIALHMLIECFVLPMQVLFYRKIVEGRGMETGKKKGAAKPAGKAAAGKKSAKRK